MQTDRYAALGLMTGMALAMLTTAPANADGRLSADSDVAGIRTTMTADQAKHAIQQQFGTASFAPLVVKFGTPEYSRDATLGFAAGIVSAKDKEANDRKMEELKKRAAGCNSFLCRPVVSGLVKDTLNVYVDPRVGGSSIMALARRTTYPPTTDILLSVFMQSLTEKFGKPSFSPFSTSYVWEEGVNSRNYAALNECAGFASHLNELERNFPRAMNDLGGGTNPGRATAKLPPCSMYLKVEVSPIRRSGPSGTDYVQSFRMDMVNVRNSFDALHAYASDFWTAAAKAKEETFKKQSQNKPHL